MHASKITSSIVLVIDESVLNKKGKVEGRIVSLALLKQQVMIDKGWSPLSLIGVETPAIFLPFINRFTDIFVVTNLYAFIFFQLNFTSSYNLLNTLIIG